MNWQVVREMDVNSILQQLLHNALQGSRTSVVTNVTNNNSSGTIPDATGKTANNVIPSQPVPVVQTFT